MIPVPWYRGTELSIVYALCDFKFCHKDIFNFFIIEGNMEASLLNNASVLAIMSSDDTNDLFLSHAAMLKYSYSLFWPSSSSDPLEV